MKSKLNFLKGVLLSSFLILIFTLNINENIFSKVFSDLGKLNQKASVISSTKTENIYNISPSKEVEGMYNFDYAFNKVTINLKKGEKLFDAPIVPFDDELARKILEKEYKILNADFGPIRDAWNYPVKPNAFMKGYKKDENKKQSFLDNLKTNKALAYDESPEPGVYNCRANTSVTGYFKAYFEDVALGNNIGYDDPVYGEGRRIEACRVLEDVSTLINIHTTTITPDIIFNRTDIIIPALAGASPYFIPGYDNGSMHSHIITEADPTPQVGLFDASILTNFNVTWSSDTPLSPGVYDFYTVLTHEIMHTLGFMSRLPVVISQTNVPQTHNTFDSFIYKDVTLAEKFINTVTGFLNVPIGAPSSWFITNDVVYQGVQNTLNATPNGIRPIYSPANWQQGSSLSHFDPSRAPGEAYIMRPSTPTNTADVLHDHEKEVLCHLGYQVDCPGLSFGQIPSSVNDNYMLVLSPPNSFICISPLQNDIGDNLHINSIDTSGFLANDYVQYYFSTSDCLGGITEISNGNVRSFWFTPSSDLSISREISYTNINPTTQMVSYPATISLVPTCENISEQEEYVCNGDFEMYPIVNNFPPTTFNELFACNGWESLVKVPYWCNYQGTPDLFRTSNIPNTSLADNGQYSAFIHSRILDGLDPIGNPMGNVEALVTELKDSLDVGQEYVLSFNLSINDMFGSSNSNNIIVGLSLEPVVGTMQSGVLPPSTQQEIFNESFSDVSEGWHYFETLFTPNNNYQSLAIWASGTYGDNNGYFFDNISIRQAETQSIYIGQITGTTYQDLNQNSTYENIEPKLPGIQVGLFQTGNPTPIQTTTTEDIPNQGKYTFNNLADGTYYTALMGESLYPQITQPGVSTDPFPTYSHMYEVTLTDGQIMENRDFGVVLNNVQTNLKLQKELIDSSLSLFDRYITWRIWIIGGGPINATNIRLLDILPEGITYHSYNSQDESISYNAETNIITLPELSAEGITYIDITTRVPLRSCGTKINTVSLTSLDQIDTNTADNTATAFIKLNPCENRLPNSVLGG